MVRKCQRAHDCFNFCAFVPAPTILFLGYIYIFFSMSCPVDGWTQGAMIGASRVAIHRRSRPGGSCEESSTATRESTYPLPNNTLPKFNIALEKRWLEDYFPFGMVHFQGLCLNFKGVCPYPSIIYYLNHLECSLLTDGFPTVQQHGMACVVRGLLGWFKWYMDLAS